jgi:hypothetical protein
VAVRVDIHLKEELVGSIMFPGVEALYDCVACRKRAQGSRTSSNTTRAGDALPPARNATSNGNTYRTLPTAASFDNGGHGEVAACI